MNTQSEHHTKNPTEQSVTRLTLFLTLGIVVIGCNSFVLSPILTDVANELGTTPVVIARVISAFGAATAITSFFFGGLVDRLGPRIILLAGGSIMALALMGSAFSQSWLWLAGSQAAIGAVVGVMLPAIYATATASAPKGEGARVLGRVLSGWGVSFVLGVPFSAFLTDLAGWRATYGVLAVFAALALAGFFKIRVIKKPQGQKAGISPLKALNISGVKPMLVVCLLYMSAFYGLYSFLGDHLRSTLGISASQAGLVVLGYGAGFALANIADGLVDRIGPGRMFPISLGIIALVYISLIPATASFFAAVGIALIWGFVNHIGVNSLLICLTQRRPGARGALMGVYTSATYGSVFLGPLLMGVFYDRWGFGIIAVFAALFLAIGAALAWRLDQGDKGLPG
jgi:predicted MFS family arabinose efflux permease